MSVKVSVLSEKGFKKEVYEFKPSYDGLEYTFYHCYRRSHLDEPWGDEWPKPDEKKWQEDNEDTHSCTDEDEYYAYKEYAQRFNPVCSTPVGGKEKYYSRSCGQAGYGLKKNHPLPKGVAERAKKQFIKTMKVG